MSKMMDNLARVQEEQPEVSQPKASLFVVKEQPVASTIASPSGPSRRKEIIVWGAAALMIAALGASFFLTQQGSLSGGSASVAQRAADSSADIASQIRVGQLSQALASLDSQLRQNPANSAALVNRAYVLKELGKHAEAEAALRALLQRRPKNAVALNNLGALLLRMGRLQEAESALHEAVSIDPGSFEARVNLAAALERKRNWPEALKLFEEVLARGEAPGQAALIRERVRRLRSLAVASVTPKEKL